MNEVDKIATALFIAEGNERFLSAPERFNLPIWQDTKHRAEQIASALHEHRSYSLQVRRDTEATCPIIETIGNGVFDEGQAFITISSNEPVSFGDTPETVLQKKIDKMDVEDITAEVMQYFYDYGWAARTVLWRNYDDPRPHWIRGVYAWDSKVDPLGENLEKLKAWFTGGVYRVDLVKNDTVIATQGDLYVDPQPQEVAAKHFSDLLPPYVSVDEIETRY